MKSDTELTQKEQLEALKAPVAAKFMETLQWGVEHGLSVAALSGIHAAFSDALKVMFMLHGENKKEELTLQWLIDNVNKEKLNQILGVN